MAERPKDVDPGLWWMIHLHQRWQALTQPLAALMIGDRGYKMTLSGSSAQGAEESLAEQQLPNKDDRFGIWSDALSERDRITLNALRHVRHSAAHGLDYGRAHGHRQAFDDRRAGQLRPMVAQADALRLNSTAGHHALSIALDLSNKAISAFRTGG